MAAIDYRHAVLRSIGYAEERYQAPGPSNNPPLAHAEGLRAERDRLRQFVVSLSVYVKEAEPDLSDALLKFAVARNVRDK